MLARSIAAAAVFACGIAAVPARADLVVTINKDIQRMSVVVDGIEKHTWLVSTGTGGGPFSGEFKPQRLERKWFSRKYGMSPMPYSVFFHEGYAIHGTIYLSRLGERASHGCVRLHPDNAAVLFDLVSQHGRDKTRIIVANDAAQAAAILVGEAIPPKPRATIRPAPSRRAAANIAPVTVFNTLY